MPRASFFLELVDRNGFVRGEAEEHDFEGRIEVTSWDWAVSDKAAKDPASKDAAAKDSGKQTKGQGDTGGQSYEPKPLRFTKATDRATTRLLNAMLKGEIFPSAKFTLRQERMIGTGSGGLKKEEFLLHLMLTDVRVTSYSFNARAQTFEVDLDEDWVFSYRTIQVDYASAPGWDKEGKKGPGLGEALVLPPGSTTTALKKPQRTTVDIDKDLAGMKADNERLRAENEKLRRSKSSSG